MSTFPFHFGSITSSQSYGASAALTTWVKAWLGRVYDRIGVRPLIYTSPSFWRNAMGDSRWFADISRPW